jgi:hypothetical protein
MIDRQGAFMSRTKIIETEEWDIIASDFSNMYDQQEISDSLDALMKIIAERDQPFCSLYDVTGTSANSVFIDRATELSKFVDSTGLSRMVAIVGVDSLAERTIASLLKPNVYFAKNIDDAIAHLSPQETI